MSHDAPPRATDVGCEELSTTRFERFLALILGVFLLIGLLWAYAQPLDRTDDAPYSNSYTYLEDDYAQPGSTYPRADPAPVASPAAPAAVPSKAEVAPAPTTVDTGPVGEPRPGDEAVIEQRTRASRALDSAIEEVSTRTDEVESTREAYRTRLDAGEPAEQFEREFSAAEQALTAAKAKLAAAKAAYDQVDLPGRQAEQRLAKKQKDRYDDLARDTFLLRLALTVGSLALSVLTLHQLHRRRPRFALLGMSAVGAATALAIVMTGDYIDIEEVGPIILSIAGTAVTFAGFLAYQRWLARRLPERRVRKNECPFCGYPMREGTHCQGCSRPTVGACTSCAEPRRVGARYCGACGAG